jgi:hypothetical protein
MKNKNTTKTPRMNYIKVLTSLALAGLVSGHAAVNYVGVTTDFSNAPTNTIRDVTTIIDLTTGEILINDGSGNAVVASDLDTLYPGTWDSATKTWTWSAADTYVLQELVFIRNGTLYIEEGSIVRGQPRTSVSDFDAGSLFISRSAKIVAAGSKDAPIIFTTASTTGAGTGGRASGASPSFWDSAPLTAPQSASVAGITGGLVVLGNAPTNADRDGGFTAATPTAQDNAIGNDNVPTAAQIFAGEGTGTGGLTHAIAAADGTFSSGTTTILRDDRSSIEGVPSTTIAALTGTDRFGGFKPTENSGTLTYVSIRHGGSNLSNNAEINGLTLGGVGSGTTVNHIEIWGNTDDGIEIFGGTVNLNNVAVFGQQDDGIDLDVGYSGVIQFALVVSGNVSDKGAELDGSYEGELVNGFNVNSPVTRNYLPLANYTIANATFIGNPAAAAHNTTAADGSHGLHIRDQAAPVIINSIVAQPRVTTAGVRVQKRTGTGTPGAISGSFTIDNERASYRQFEKGVAQFRGVTLYSPSITTVADWVLSGVPAEDTIIEAALSAAERGNLFNANPGFKKLPTTAGEAGFPVGVSTNINPVPRSGTGFSASASESVFVGDDVFNSNKAIVSVDYRGAFDFSSLSSSLWTTGWTAANRSGYLVSRGNQ